MGFDKTELKEKKKVLLKACKDLLTKIDCLDEQFNDYIQFLGDEEKENAMENWEIKQDELFELKDSIVNWIENSKTIK